MSLYQYSGSGYFSQTNIGLEVKAFSYNDSSVVLYETEDYSVISEVFSESENYQYLTPATSSEDYDFITGTELYPYGSIFISGESESTYRNVNIYGPVESVSSITYSPDNLGGSLFNIGEKIERRSYSYNDSSSEGEIFLDYANISSESASSDDFGFVSDLSVGSVDDYSLISQSVIPILPFGSITLNGSALTQQSIRIYLSGSSAEKIVYSPDNTSGVLFGFGEKVESITYDYTDDSIFITYNEYDYGTITLIPNEYDEDYRFITSPQDSIDDYNLIVGYGTTETQYPYSFGVSLTFSGIASTREFGIYGYYGDDADPGTSGLFTISGELVHPNIDYTPHYGIEKNIGIGTTGIQIGSSAVEKNTESYVGSGSLFEFGEKLESVTYDYNENSITPNFDYGLVSQIASENGDDYGFIVDLEQSYEDYEFIVNPISVGSQYPYSFGVALTFSGIASTREIQVYGINPGDHLYPQPPDISSGLISIFGELIHPDIDFTPAETGGGIITLSGSIIEKNTESYVGSGSLFEFGEKLESVTYDYNETSLVEDLDWQSIGSSPDEESDDFGLVNQIPTEFQSWGFLNGLGSGSGNPFGSIYILGSGLEAFDKAPYEGETVLYNFSGIASTKEIAVYGYYGDDLNPGTSGQLIISGELVHPNIDYTPHYGIEKNIGIGTTGIQITETSTALESFIANPPENEQLFIISGSIIEKNTESYVGIGTLFNISGALESDVDSYSASGTLTISGSALESLSAQTPEDTILFKFDETENGRGRYSFNQQYVSALPSTPITLSGELVHPNIDYTPHYGIEKNIGIGTTGIQIRRGVGYTPDSEGNPRDARTYSNRYGINDKVPGAGIGTFRFDQTRDLAKYSPLTPYTGTGLFNIITGFSPQQVYPWLPGPGVGKSWSFTRSTYIASGITTISGIASTKEIAVYGYYGNDNNPGTSGTIFISQQTTPIIEKEIDAYVAIGTYLVSGISDTIQSRSYNGSGTLTLTGTVFESLSAQTPEDTQLFTISGVALEVYSAQTPEIEVLYVISGFVIERKTNSYNGSGSITLSGSSRTIEVPSYPTRGLLRFVSHTVDHDYDTCDSEEFTCDSQDSAYVSFSANPVENTVLFDVGGISSTRKISTYEYIGISTFVLSGFVENIQLTYSEVGFGTIFVSDTVEDKETDVYIGYGTIFGLSGGSESYSIQPSEDTILLSINGSAITSIESDYVIVGIGLFNFYSESITRKLSTFTQVGSGILTVSGQLNYPDIIFIPSPDGSGTITILGSSDESISRMYENTSGTMFQISSGFESFTKSGYIGLGTINIEQNAASIINNPFQIPRTYVVII